MMTVSPSDAPRPDIDRLVELVATVESTQRAEDADGFLALFHDDAVWVTGGGVRLVGKEAIAAFTRSVLPGAMVGVTVDYVVDHVRFLTPDVALTGVDQEYRPQDGSPSSRGLPSYVWVRETDGRWLLAVGQNTAVPT
ncbi:SgcJ/EcaC family oxidoreductase [Cellulomonas humilata]|nr:SgcJ/EcaC family oxidoreductase [Cellulomonas humilata]